MTKAATQEKLAASRRDWPVVAFGDVVKNVSETCREPEAEGLERYLGLEHFDSENLHLKRWGLLAEDEVSFTRRFREGQVLFGKRRAYLKKVAVAEFDGICSSDILCFAPKDPEVLLPELLPFIVQSDGFFAHALGTSSGSLSPRTRWSQLKDYRFPLPPVDEQRRIVQLLWAADEVVERWREALGSLTQLLDCTAFHIFQSRANDEHWPIRKLKDIARVERGKFTHRPRNLPEFYGGPYPFAQTGDVAASNGYITEFASTLSEEGVQYSKSFPPETMLITIAAVIGATAITPHDVWCTDSVVGVVPGDEVDVWYLEAFFRTKRDELENRIATQSAQKNINLQKLKPIEVPLPDASIQQRVVDDLKSIRTSLAEAETHMGKSNGVLVSLRESLIGDNQ